MLGGSTHNLGSGSRLLQGWSASSVPPFPHYQGKAHLHCPCEFTPFSDEQGQGQFSCFHVLSVKSLPPTLAMTVLLYGPGMA